MTGTTINRYLTNVRMEKAKELLMDLSNKLYDVSYAVGYMNPSYFSRQFKKIMWAACPRSTATGGCPGSEAGALQDHGDLLQSPLPKAGGLLFALGAALRKSGAACERGRAPA